jgi:hypothetical protein
MYILLGILLLIILCLVAMIFNIKEEQTTINTIAPRIFHQMARWSTAASQDKNPVIAVLHANYGVGYMMVLKDLASDEDLERMLGVENIRKVFDEVQKIQNNVTLNLANHCTNIFPDTFLANYGSYPISNMV